MGDRPADGGDPSSDPPMNPQESDDSKQMAGTGPIVHSSYPILQSTSGGTKPHQQPNVSPVTQVQQTRPNFSSSPNRIDGVSGEEKTGLNNPSPTLQAQGTSTFNMSGMSNALHTAQSGQRGLSGASTSAVVYQLQQISQYPGHHPIAYQYPQQPYGANFGSSPLQNVYMTAQPGHQPMYAQYLPHMHQQRSMIPSTFQQGYTNHVSPNAPQYVYYAPTYGPQPALISSQIQQAQPQHVPFVRRASLPSQLPHSFLHGLDTTSMSIGNYQQHALHMHQAPLSAGPGQGILLPSPAHAVGQGAVNTYLAQPPPIVPSPTGVQRPTAGASAPSIPRGPPRKPKQSGHALWVGNLPPGTTVIELKDHFSRDATKEIESLFLISKSNCAFVNYRTEASCSAAMHRFHDSRFKGVRLVCRLRRSSVPASGIPTGPSAMSASRAPSVAPQDSTPEENEEDVQEVSAEAAGEPVQQEGSLPAKIPERYYIVKSLTLQDLELSVRNGIWATQSHNEETLNRAYQSANNVYLIFSANKSGEYFGYARMISPISEDATDILRSISVTSEPIESTDVPKTIQTSATEFAPKGRIIDDSARGTIFWEAEISDDEEEPSKPTEENPGDDPMSEQTWGKPFRVVWMSTARLPFYRTRGLRNPWNANREVKIARDGTELEPSIGRRLVQMFHKATAPHAGSSGVQLMQMPPSIGGSPLRPY